MARLTGQAELCRRAAAECRKQADITEGRIRVLYWDLATHWLKLAKSYELAVEVSGFLQWDAQRLEPPSAFQRN